ncbi:MAG TPA: FAD-dependent oxidoreductase [Actinomycetes bacterium]|nr:FAD-dependent oxidoreductase [Actinomycetes bacterium]
MNITARTSGQPRIVVVEADAAARERITEQLTRRYGLDYGVVAEVSGQDGIAALRSLRDENAQVAIVLCDLSGSEFADGDSFFGLVGSIYPEAKRGLLVDWGSWADPATVEVILRLMALSKIDYYVLKPWRLPDEYFHRTMTEFLLEWERATSVVPREVTVIGTAWARRSHELRSLLARNGVLHTFQASDSDIGRRMLVEAGLSEADTPVVLLYDGRALVNPTNVEVANAYGVSTQLDADTDFDLVVVGAGPAGLAAAVYASSEGLRTLVVERESIGGQAGSSSLIRNYLGFARGVGGAELAQRAFQQAWVFGTRFLFMEEVVELRSEGRWNVLTTADGEQARARAVVLATGVSYRRIGVPGLEALTGTGVFYGASVSEARALAGTDVFVVGGGNSAGQAAMHLARYARTVTLLVRSASLAESMSQYLRDELSAVGVRVRFHTEVVDGGGDGRLEWITLRDRQSGQTQREAASALFVLIGAQPHTGWLPPHIQRDQWGYVVTGRDVYHDQAGSLWALPRPPMMFETCVPGIFAVGDVRRGSVKRVASAVGEGSVVLAQVHESLAGDVPAEVPAEHGAATGSGR